MDISSSTLPSAWSSALTGMNAGFKQIEQSATTIAHQAGTESNEPSRQSRSDNNLNDALVQQKQATYLVQANTQTLQVAQSNMGTLLDIMA